ncbi:MAG: 3-isopropylmalate dehydratase large subunit [Thaumarchaeota archaeon]|nr:3-isopropylmalate dehydratase large subunit [Nitrososphaerota archaeon]MCL5316882.1 3-isopropylmalate dehydratase large subunit [Nitrososphaerota archaeon]
MNVIEKILSRASGEKEVVPGQIVDAKIDHAMINEITGYLVARYFHEVGAKKVWDPKKVTVVLDHTIPAPTAEAAEVHRLVRDFARELNLPGFYDVGRGGVCHQVMVEKGNVKPGDVIVGADSHTVTYGGLGAFSTGIGSTEMTSVFITGKLWFKVPKIIRIDVTGKFGKYVGAKDLFLRVAREIGFSGATYMGLEFKGPTVKKLSVSSRLTLCNMTIEVGGKAGIVEPDEKTIEYVKSKTSEPFNPLYSDPDAEYARTLKVDVTGMQSQVACPNAVDNVKPVSELSGVELDQVYIGSCTNGRIEDLKIAADIVRGKKVNPRTRLVVVPASQEVFIDAMKEGLIQTFAEAGAAIATASCGACYGGHLGVLAAGETCLSTTNRNFIGRMGDPMAKVYLGSPAVAAASALTGRITDPETLR